MKNLMLEVLREMLDEGKFDARKYDLIKKIYNCIDDDKDFEEIVTKFLSEVAE